MKLTTTIFWQVLLVLCIAVCGVWIAAQWTASQLAYSPRLGEPWFVLSDTPIYEPWRFFGWWYSFEAY
ncbi:MAG: conjugal transfer protein TraG, partial [Pseudomonadota bacterium]